MRRCLQLAGCGIMGAKPNPMVGAVIVSGDGRIIGEGYHRRCGGPHAEVNAFASVRPEDQPLLSDATIYVSLEPCSHYGKTPPCADLIIKKGVKRCVVGCVDPFAKVHGRGIQKLRDAGIEVTVGVLDDECRELNRRFTTDPTLRSSGQRQPTTSSTTKAVRLPYPPPSPRCFRTACAPRQTPYSWVAPPTNANIRSSTHAFGQDHRPDVSSSTAAIRHSRDSTSAVP